MSNFPFGNQDQAGKKDTTASQPQDFLSLDNQIDYSEGNGVNLNQLMFSSNSFTDSSPNLKPMDHSGLEENSYIPIRHTHPRGSWVFMKGYGQRILTPQGKKLMCLFPKCGRMYVDANGSTNGLKSHLRKVHKVTSEDEPSDFSQIKRVPFPLKPNLFKPSTFLSSAAPAAPRYSPQLSTLQEALVEFFAYNGLPPRFTIDENFQKILRLALPTGELPNLQQEIEQHFLDTKAKLKKVLMGQISISLSITSWETHYALTAHFIDDMWVHKQLLLALVPSDPQFSSQLAETIMEMLDEFGITSLISSLTTDGSARMSLLAQDLSKIAAGRRDFDFVPSQHHVTCLGHIISCAVNDALRTADKGGLWARLDRLRTSINAICTSSAKLEIYQRFFSHRYRPYLELLLDDTSKWSSTLNMLERIQEVCEAFNEARLHGDHTSTPLNQEDLDFFEELKNFLGPFQAFVSRIAASGYPTISKTCLLYDKMLMYLSTPTPQKPIFIQQASYFAQQVFACQFSKSHSSTIFPLASTLDPRIKFSYWKPPLYSKEDTDRFVTVVQNYWDQNSGQDSDLNGKSSFDNIFELEPVEKSNDLHRYLSEPLLTSGFSDSNGILQYWKSNASNFPNLSKFARRFLAVPVSSAPWEAIFSSTLPSLAPDATVQSTLLKEWKSFLG